MHKNWDKPEDYVNKKQPLKDVGIKYQGMSIVNTNKGDVTFYQKNGDTKDRSMKLLQQRSFRKKLMELLHVKHGAALGQYETATDIWWWTNMKKHIEDYCDSFYSYNPGDY